jgi:hypothetical protein
VHVARGAGTFGEGLTIAYAGAEGQKVAKELASRADAPLPAPAVRALPALWDVDGLVSIPHLRYERERPSAKTGSSMKARFRPLLSLTPAVAGAN